MRILMRQPKKRLQTEGSTLRWELMLLLQLPASSLPSPYI